VGLLDRLVNRLRTTRTDALLAVAFTVIGLVQAALFPIAPRGIGELYVVGSTVPLAWRRTYPIEAALVSAAFWLVPLDGYPLLGFVAVVLQFFPVGTRGEPLRAVVATTVVASALSVVGTLVGPELPVAAIGGVLVVVGPVLAGRLVRHQRLQNQALATLTEELRVERDRAEQAAVGAERARIAQELHDVVGHEVTLIAIQAEAAGVALRVAPERAAEPIETIRSTAHRVLGEMRGVVNALATSEAGPGTEDLRALTDRARAAGIDNTLTVTGAPLPDQAPASMAAYRIVQECLTNAGRHAPGHPLAVHVDWGPHEVLVHASNAADGAPDPRPGRGLTGIRHRAELLGGTFAAGSEDGRFDVRVTIPAGPREVR
jgi:signal transduction histidine kinase